MKDNKPALWIIAGGTGGHIAPAVSLAQAASDNKDNDLLFFTLGKNRDYPDIRELSKSGVPVEYIETTPFSVKPVLFIKLFRLLLINFKLFNRIVKARGAPLAVVGFGGYPAFPLLLWALIKRIDIYLHEQNSVFGLVNRLFTPFANKVFTAFPVKNGKKQKKFIHSGIPLRKLFTMKRKKGESRNSSIDNILIIGGSQGASDLNNLYKELIKHPFFKKIRFTISAGKSDYENIAALARKQDKVFAFIENIADQFLLNDLIITRAGAGALFEVLWSEKPAVFIPFPFATNDHQAKNGSYLLDDPRYIMIDQRPFQPEKATAELVSWLKSNSFQDNKKTTVKGWPKDPADLILKKINLSTNK